MPTLSDAEAVMVMVVLRVTVLPSAGLVIETVGRVVSTGLDTVTEISGDEPALFAAS